MKISNIKLLLYYGTVLVSQEKAKFDILFPISHSTISKRRWNFKAHENKKEDYVNKMRTGRRKRTEVLEFNFVIISSENNTPNLIILIDRISK